MADQTIIASPFFRHDVIDKVILATPSSDHKTMLALLASKIRLCEDDLASASPPPDGMQKLLASRTRYAKLLLEDVQVGKAESEASRLLQYCRDVDRRHEQEAYSADIHTAALYTQLTCLDMLKEIDESLGKQGRVKRWIEQRAKLLDRMAAGH